MRPDPPTSIRQQRLESFKPTITTNRQQNTTILSERMTRGFKRNAQRIAAKQNIPYSRAAAILAASSRRASAAAYRKNPRLRKVRGAKDKGK